MSPSSRFTAIVILATLAACARVAPSGPRLLMPRYASVAIAPRFAHYPAGAPTVALSRLRGVLHAATGDSIVDDAQFHGHTAALGFSVDFVGDSALFRLDLAAYDLHDQLAYRATDTLVVRQGTNPPFQTRDLVYAGADSGVATIQVVPDPVQLQPGDSTSLAVSAANTSGQAVDVPVRIGWTSRADSIVAIDSTGRIHAGFTAGSTYVVAVSASGAVDSALVQVLPGAVP